MRVAGKIILGFIFILLFPVFLLSTTIKFQILNTNFWLKAYDSKFYEDFSRVMTSNFKNEGVPQEEIDQFNAFLNQDIGDKNIERFIDYLNGKSGELFLYLPLDKLKNGILPARFISPEGAVSAKRLIMGSGRKNPNFFDQLSQLEFFNSVVWFILATLLFLIILYFYKINRNKKRLISLGLVFSLSFFVSLVLASTMEIIRINWIRDPFSKGEPVLIRVIAPPLMYGIVRFWFVLAGLLAFLALLCFWKKKNKINFFSFAYII